MDSEDASAEPLSWRDKIELQHQRWLRDILRELYVEKNIKIHRIAAALDCSEGRLWYWLRKYGLDKEHRARYAPRDEPCS